MKYYCLLLLLWSQACWLAAQKTIYVNASVTGTQTGQSWPAAMNNLQNALRAAKAGDQIWVAKGTYKPTGDDNRSATFLLQPGVRLLGGFAGGESNVNQRNLSNTANSVVLSGEIGNTTTTEDNSYHVVSIVDGDSTTVLDGFTIQYGSALQPFGTINPDDYGGGVLVKSEKKECTPVIQRCMLSYNFARYGAVGCFGDGAIPIIRDCAFQFNRALSNGGAFYKRGPNTPTRALSFTNCTFKENRAKNEGGAVYLGSPTNRIVFRRCQFEGDSANAGGAIFSFIRDESVKDITYEFERCTFNYNKASSGGGGVWISNAVNGRPNIKIKMQEVGFLWCATDLNQGGGMQVSSTLGDSNIDFSANECVIFANQSFGPGAGIYFAINSGANTNISLNRCDFTGNHTRAAGGGAIAYRGVFNLPRKCRFTVSNSLFVDNIGALSFIDAIGGSQVSAVNCTFFHNGEYPFNKFWAPELSTNQQTKMEILNSIIWEENALEPQFLLSNNNPDYLSVNDYKLDYSLVNFKSLTYRDYNPGGSNMIYGKDPRFYDPNFNYDFTYPLCAPAHDAGSSIIVDTFGLRTDLRGNPRKVGRSVDMGAYELQAGCTTATEEDRDGTTSLLSISLRQNPVSTYQNLEASIFTLRSGEYYWALTGVNGQTVGQGKQLVSGGMPAPFVFDINNLSNGVYFLTVRSASGDRVARKKVVVHRD